MTADLESAQARGAAAGRWREAFDKHVAAKLDRVRRNRCKRSSKRCYGRNWCQAPNHWMCPRGAPVAPFRTLSRQLVNFW